MASIEGPAETAAAATSSAATEAAAALGGKERDVLGDEFRAAPATTEERRVNDGADLHRLRFDLTAAVAYHAIRELFFARLNRILTGLQVFLGTSAIAALPEVVPIDPLWPLLLSAFAGVVLLVIDPAAAAREHRALRSRLHGLLADLEEDPSGARIRTTRGAIQKVAGDAPPGFRAVQAMAYNTAVNATYDDALAARYRFHIGFWKSLFANVLPMRWATFRRPPLDTALS